jgi:flagellar biosynthesis protein FlhB
VADSSGKTEKPTPRRIRNARKEGQFPRTPDASAWLAVLVGTALLPHTAGTMLQVVHAEFRLLPEIAADPAPARALAVLARIPRDVFTVAAPLCFSAVAAAALAQAAQGVHPTTKTLKPKFNRLSPKQGIKRMFGTRAAWEAVKSLAKVSVIALVAFGVAYTLVPALLIESLPLATVMRRTGDGLRSLIWAASLAGLVLAGADYAYQKHSVLKQLRMTPREVKDESKQAEGDPMVKGAIRSRQLSISRNRMLSEVADADVVLVNPTHFAVALAYDPAKGAPRVVAKGAGTLAAKIRDRAREHRIPVVEDKPLTRTLYRVCDLGDEIPAELYLVVARILAFVMTAGRPGSRGDARRTPGNAPAIPDLPSKAQLRARRSRQSREGRRATRPTPNSPAS